LVIAPQVSIINLFYPYLYQAFKMKVTLAVAALVAGVTSMSLPRNNGNCQLSDEAQTAVLAVQQLISATKEFSTTLLEFPTNGTEADFVPLVTAENVVKGSFTSVEKAITRISKGNAGCDFTQVVAVLKQWGELSIQVDNDLLPLQAVLTAASPATAAEFFDNGIDAALDFYGSLNATIPCPFITQLEGVFDAELTLYEPLIGEEEASGSLNSCIGGQTYHDQK
jgi:hypothetical protein